jgi:competence protein ComK
LKKGGENLFHPYKIGKTTMAIKSEYTTTHSSVIYDLNGQFESKKEVKELLNEACIQRGSTYEGRIKAAKALLSFKNKTPLMICPHECIYAFPTISPEKYQCTWIFLRHVKEYYYRGTKLFVKFKNEEALEVYSSLHILTKQKQHTLELMFHFSEPLFSGYQNKNEQKYKNLYT